MARLKDDPGDPSEGPDPPCHDPLAELVKRLQQGTDFERDFDRLYCRLHPKLMRFFERRGFRPQEAEELTQETFLRVYKSIGKFAYRSSFARWLFEIALNVYYNEIRRLHAAMRKGREEQLPEEIDAADEGAGETTRALIAPGPNPLDAAVEHEDLEELRRALATLPPRMRTSIFLRHQGRQYSEIAEIMGLSIETVKAHLHQARTRLRSLLADEESEVER